MSCSRGATSGVDSVRLSVQRGGVSTHRGLSTKRYLVWTARVVLFAFYDLGNVDAANFFIGLYSQRVQRLIDTGRISGERADILAEYGDVISLVFAIG
ncbi:hypothetical protein BMS3Bbin02_02102 [bacterium BMS3Bbin02]|nr:hypothetical protein BMS3Bbin02_02102 [bacterium BMS3Bbin02]